MGKEVIIVEKDNVEQIRKILVYSPFLTLLTRSLFIFLLTDRCFIYRYLFFDWFCWTKDHSGTYFLAIKFGIMHATGENRLHTGYNSANSSCENDWSCLLIHGNMEALIETQLRKG